MVLLYDFEYCQLQANLCFCWCTDVQYVIHLLSKLRGGQGLYAATNIILQRVALSQGTSVHTFVLCQDVMGHTLSLQILQIPRSPNQCQHHLNYIHIPCPELSCFTVTVFQNFQFQCMVSTVYVSKQRRLIDHIIILV